MKNKINYINYIKQVKLLFIILLSVSITIPAAIGFNAFLLKLLYDNIFINFKETLLFKISILLFISSIIISFFKIIKKITTVKMKLILAEKIREELTNEIVKYEYKYFVKKNTAEIITCLIADCENVAEGIIKIFLGLSNLIIVIIWLTLFFIFIKWIFLIYLFSVIIIFVWILLWIMPIQNSTDILILRSRELYKFIFKIAYSIKVIKYELLQNNMLKELEIILKNINKYLMKNIICHNFLYTIYDPIFYILNIFLIYFGAYEINKGNFTIGFFTVILILMWSILEPLIEMSKILISKNELNAAFKRIAEYKTGVHETGGNNKFTGINNEIKFSNLYFKYNKNSFNLKNINLKIKKGQNIAIAGKTGTGKSTISSLLINLYKPYKGTIYFDNNNISQYSLESIRDYIIIVPQEAFIYPTTLRKNIDVKNNLTDKEIHKLINNLNLTKLVSKLPQGLDTIIYDNLNGLSGGEIQRIGIARSLSLKGKIYIFDEITSHLDPKTAVSIINYISNLPGNITKIYITHDLKIASYMDKIFVLSNNRICELDNINNSVKENKLLEIIK